VRRELDSRTTLTTFRTLFLLVVICAGVAVALASSAGHLGFHSDDWALLNPEVASVTELLT